jgi:hypothetical protein
MRAKGKDKYISQAAQVFQGGSKGGARNVEEIGMAWPSMIKVSVAMALKVKVIDEDIHGRMNNGGDRWRGRGGSGGDRGWRAGRRQAGFSRRIGPGIYDAEWR